MVVGFLMIIGLALAIWLFSSDGKSDTPQSHPSHRAPVTSEGARVQGSYPAPDSDPCWKATERAVEISPEDGGQSAMPQDCIDRGF
ncbi:MAG: hypothetical protein EDQ89_03770 [Acidobacteria bacterium]|nr:MAG: hypothetical protein EDQ89_03770 [Acidobacteriota bacterium]